MTKNKTIKLKRIPEFKSIEEEAQFWDTHSTTDYENEFKPIRVNFGKQLSTGVSIHFNPKIFERVRILAHKKRIGPTTLIHMWVLERLREHPTASRK